MEAERNSQMPNRASQAEGTRGDKKVKITFEEYQKIGFSIVQFLQAAEKQG